MFLTNKIRLKLSEQMMQVYWSPYVENETFFVKTLKAKNTKIFVCTGLAKTQPVRISQYEIKVKTQAKCCKMLKCSKVSENDKHFLFFEISIATTIFLVWLFWLLLRTVLAYHELLRILATVWLFLIGYSVPKFACTTIIPIVYCRFYKAWNSDLDDNCDRTNHITFNDIKLRARCF